MYLDVLLQYNARDAGGAGAPEENELIHHLTLAGIITRPIT